MSVFRSECHKNPFIFDYDHQNELDELEINYLKMSFGKWVVIKKDLDSTEIKDLIQIRAHNDGRS